MIARAVVVVPLRAVHPPTAVLPMLEVTGGVETDTVVVPSTEFCWQTSTRMFDTPSQKKGVEKVDVKPIYFDYDKYDITPLAVEELTKVVFIMQKFPNIRIKIESHTDSRGKDAYNLKLSDNRAKSTRDYIISQGIDASRIESAIGYGESRLINKCKNGVKCTEEEHLLNRRSDFIIIQK